MRSLQVFVLLVLVCAALAEAGTLGTFKTKKSSLTVSGLSSGASMATQFHVAYSSRVRGVGTFAGSPYYCSGGTLLGAYFNCILDPATNFNMVDVLEKTEEYAANGQIDATCNMRKDRAFIWQSTVDGTVNPANAALVAEYYNNYVMNDNKVELVNDMDASHTMPTANYGNACNESASPFISDCDYAGAYTMLKHLYRKLSAPQAYGVELPGELYEFDQTEFINDFANASMGDIGYVYIPSSCTETRRGKKCKVHVAFHGCSQNKASIGDEFVMNAGYNEVAERNNIIVIYPQAAASPNNPFSCWDWWGYTNQDFATVTGMQNLAVCNMVARVTGEDPENFCAATPYCGC